MAAENSDDHPAPPQPAPSLPEYPEMITAAIDALNGGSGSNKTAISDYIASTYGDLPPDHGELLAEHLNKMMESGGLAMVNDNYVKLDAAPPAKRGRGRPPKAKAAVSAAVGAGPVAPAADGTVVSPTRGRGRPPKSRDPLAPPPQPKSPTKSGRPRGRPPKKAKTTPSSAPTSAPATAPTTGAPRGRGRPPKVKPAVAPVGC